MESTGANHHRPYARRPRRSPQAALATSDDAVADVLLHAAGQGDERALGAFYDRTAPAVYGLLHGVVKEQAVTERITELVYLQMWRAAPHFDPNRRSARSLLMRAALRELIRHMHDIDPSPRC